MEVEGGMCPSATLLATLMVIMTLLLLLLSVWCDVICSTGAGKTGVFIALSIVLERMRFEGVVDMFQTVNILRTQRPSMVHTEVHERSIQFHLVHNIEDTSYSGITRRGWSPRAAVRRGRQKLGWSGISNQGWKMASKKPKKPKSKI